MTNRSVLQRWCLTAVVLILISVATINAQKGGTKGGASTDAEKAVAQAQVLLKQGNAAESVKILQAAAANSPNDFQIRFWLGKILYQQGQYQPAIEQFKIFEAKPDKNIDEYRESVQMIGLSHYALGHLAEAVPYLEKMAAVASGNSEINYALGVALIQTRQPAKARETFARLFNVPKDSAAAYLLNAKMHVRQQFEEVAETELNQALALNPKLPEVRFVLGELAIYHAQIDKGIELLKQEIALNPSSAMAYYRLGEGLSRQLKWDEAVPPLQKSIWINPFFSGPYIVLGKVYLKKNDLSNAELLLRRAAAIDPRNFGAHQLLAQVLQQAGKADEAKAEFAFADKLRGANEKEP